MEPRLHLHKTSASMLQEICDDASNSVLIENNRVTAGWSCNSFSSVSIDFNENRIVQPHGRVGTDAECEWTLKGIIYCISFNAYYQ